MTTLFSIFLITVATSTLAVDGQSCECGVESLKTRIIDGRPAQSRRYPWMASVLIQSGNMMSSCGGSLINDRYILTAAHCMKSLKSVSQLKVTLGAHSAEERQIITPLEVEKVITHPDWKSFDDISLIKLKNPINDVSPVCLPSFTKYDNLFVTGWGMTGKSGNSLLSRATELMEVDTEEVDAMTCKQRHFPQVNPEKEICAGGKKGGSCMGDSGGPLQTRKNGRVYQVGIVSFGATDCATVTNSPNVYERVTGQLDWIKKHTTDAHWCEGPEQALESKGSTGSGTTSKPSRIQRPKPTMAPRPTFVTVPDRKPARPSSPMSPASVRPITSGSRVTVISRPGGKTQVVSSSSSSSDDTLNELEELMQQSGFRTGGLFPSDLGRSTTTKKVVNIPGGRRVITTTTSRGGNSDGLLALERELNRMFI